MKLNGSLKWAKHLTHLFVLRHWAVRLRRGTAQEAVHPVLIEVKQLGHRQRVAPLRGFGLCRGGMRAASDLALEGLKLKKSDKNKNVKGGMVLDGAGENLPRNAVDESLNTLIL